MMERSEMLAATGELKLYGMKAAFDEIISTAVKRQHEPQRIIGDLLTAEITQKQARSVKYLWVPKISSGAGADASMGYPDGGMTNLLKLHCVADDLSREAMPRIGDGPGRHPVSLARFLSGHQPG